MKRGAGSLCLWIFCGVGFVFTSSSQAERKNNASRINEIKLELMHGCLCWQVNDGFWQMSILEKTGKVLASEEEHTGYATYLKGKFYKLRIPAHVVPQKDKGHINWQWEQNIQGIGAEVQARFARCKTGDAVRLTIIFQFNQTITQPHFSWGLDIAVEDSLNGYHWIPGPTATAYSYEEPALTLWLLSTYDHKKGIQKLDGCQALITIPRGRVMSLQTRFRKPPPPEKKLEMHLRMPPGYEDANPRKNVLPAGTPVRLHGYILLAGRYFCDSVLRVHKLQPLEPLPARFDYQKHLRDVVKSLLDPAKYYEEHRGIVYYCHGEKPPEKPRICKGREGPGWGGAFDAEMAYFLMRYAQQYETDQAKKELLKNHVRRMIDGWLTNPRFLFSDDLTWRHPGDMRASMSPSMGWKRRGNPPIVWTAHQAYMLNFLIDLYRQGGWNDCKHWAVEIGEWTLRNQRPDGSLPGAWIVQGNQASPHGGFQPASVVWMISALLNLDELAPDQRWHQAARRIADCYVDDLLAPRPEYGNGELALVVWEAKAIIPTSLAYIICGYADAYKKWQDPKYKTVVDRYGRMLIALGATWEPHEELLRGRKKIQCPPYGMDLKMAGGISCGTFRHFYLYQMNRNEIGYALMRAYEVLKDPVYLKWLRAFIHWHLHFVFTREVEFSPVTTYGCAPQNHRWTSNDLACWDIDWGCTSAKMAALILDCLEQNYLNISPKPRVCHVPEGKIPQAPDL